MGGLGAADVRPRYSGVELNDGKSKLQVRRNYYVAPVSLHAAPTEREFIFIWCVRRSPPGVAAEYKRSWLLYYFVPGTL